MRTGARRVLELLRRLPFTLATLSALGLAAWRTRSVRRSLPRDSLRSAGFAPRDLGADWHRLLTSAFLTHGREVLVRAGASTALCVGTAELREGSRATAATFWLVHCATLVTLAVAIGGVRSASPGTIPDRLPRDVGPSAGYLGCLGLVCARLPEPLPLRAGLSVSTALVAALFLPPLSSTGREAKRMADLAHLLAFPLGFALGRIR